MALPKRRHSTTRGRKRRTHQKLTVQSLVRCTQCKQLKLPHRICPHCGYYNGNPIIVMEEKKPKQKRG